MVFGAFTLPFIGLYYFDFAGGIVGLGLLFLFLCWMGTGPSS